MNNNKSSLRNLSSSKLYNHKQVVNNYQVFKKIYKKLYNHNLLKWHKNNKNKIAIIQMILMIKIMQKIIKMFKNYNKKKYNHQ